MPFKNQHACRLIDPSLIKEDSFRTHQTSIKGLTFISGKLKSTGKSVVQTFRYDKKVWNEERARKHCTTKKGKFEAAVKSTKSNQLYEIHRKLHSQWNNEEVDKELLIKLHSQIISEYKKEGMFHRQIDSLDKNKIKRWNISLSENFDVLEVESKPATFEYEMYSKYLSTSVKNIFYNDFSIPMPMLGTYLAGFKEILKEFNQIETRRFDYNGLELPPVYEVIKLNSKKSDDFLINGVNFYSSIIIKYSPTMFGMNASLISTLENKEWNKELMQKVKNWVAENNYMKNEKFALNGEFLEKTDDDWDNLILENSIVRTIQNGIRVLEKDNELKSRGMMFIGKPGTGKTLTGRVLMNKLDSTFIWVSSKDLKNNYGEIDPIKTLTLSFQLARELSPSVLFIEDIDTWLEQYTIDLLKTELDGIKENKNILTILTTNNPEKLPDSLLDRPGRFHDIINFTLPSEEKRKEMILKWFDKIKDETMKEIIEKTEGFSGAHMKELINFSKSILEETEIGKSVDKSLLQSLEKLLEQKKLIENIKKEDKKI